MINLCSSSLRRSVLRLMPSHSAAFGSGCRRHVHHHVEQRLLDRVHDHLVHRMRLGAAQVLEVGSRLSRMHSSMCFLLMQRSGSEAHLFVVGRRCAERQPLVPVGERVEPVGHGATAATSQLSSVFMCARNASPPGSARTAQPMCLRALRTPACSPYRRSGRRRCSSSQLPRLQDAGRRELLAGGEEVRDLAKDPRPALRGAADHQRVGAGRAQHLARLLAAYRCRRWRRPGSRSAAFTAATVSYSASPP